MLLSPEVQAFIDKNLHADFFKLALQKNPFPNMEWTSILNQIACKSKARCKLPTFFQTANIIYPSKISLEQTSSEKTARYKAEVICGNSIIDLTGGFGVDSVFFAKKFGQVIHCEMNDELSQIAHHNFKALHCKNIETICGDGLEILKNKNQKFDWIYVDPSRRNDAKGKVFMLKDSMPNVPDLLSTYLTYGDKILIKTAPILDINAGILELKNVKNIQIVAVENEVKELLWVVEKDYLQGIQINTINIICEKIEHFSFNYFGNVDKANLDFPQKYLYEPNASIMKSGGFDALSFEYNMAKLHQNSHLYTSNSIKYFPGRAFEIVSTFAYSKTNMNLYLKDIKANVAIRNFTETVEALRKKWKIEDGGNIYCFFTTNKNEQKIVIICKKL